MSVIEKQISTVAVSTPLNAIPVPGVERIEGFTTTMYDIVKKVVTPAMASVLRSIRQDYRIYKADRIPKSLLLILQIL